MRVYCRNGYRLVVVCMGLILAAGCANPVRNQAQETSALHLAGTSELPPRGGANQTKQSSETGRFFESAGKDFADWPSRIYEDSKAALLSGDNFTTLLLAGGASAAMYHSNADKNLSGNFERHRGFQHITEEALNVIGSPATHFAATGLWYAISAEGQDEFNRERAWTMMTALSVTGVVTVGLKAIRDNETPNGKQWAWPSGHTASSFTVASVLDEFYGPRVGVPAYIAASLVGWRMMDTGDHWASDVLFGATLGWVVGHTVADRHKQLEIAGFTVLPYTVNNNGSVIGVTLVKRF